MNVCAIIPAYKPSNDFICVIKSLIDGGFDRIIVINDGSGSEFTPYFDTASSFPQCTVLTHAVNLGKGRALKTAFNYFLSECSEYDGVVTVDADNQHNIDDILNCVSEFNKDKESIILGCRNFSDKNVPLRSRFGNNMTSFVFRTLCGMKISDTQTGLRVISKESAKVFMNVLGERYEYETNMLLEINKRQMPIKEVTIKTIYIDGNSSSHFNPLTDSFKIYVQIVKYISSSLAASLTDILSYALFLWILHTVTSFKEAIAILIASVSARIISSLVNYKINKDIVFGNRCKKGSILRYYCLAVLILAASYGLTYAFSLIIPISSVFIKIVVDTLLFLVSFKMQREWVFKR